MGRIYSNANGQVIEATDKRGTYYYVADGLGSPVIGWWADEDEAVKALEAPEGHEPARDGDIYEDGTREHPTVARAAAIGRRDPGRHPAYYIDNREIESAEDEAYLDEPRAVELFSTDQPHYLPAGEDANEVEFIAEYGLLREAMDAAEAMGCGYYLTSSPDRWRYTGRIRVAPGTGPNYETI